MSAVMEHNGVPVDMEICDLLLRTGSVGISSVTRSCPRSTRNTASTCRDARGSGASTPNASRTTANAQGILWPRHEATGKLDLRDKTFDSMAKAYPETEALRQLRHTRSQMRKVKLAVGGDGCTRTVLWPFVSKTGALATESLGMDFFPGGVAAGR